MKYLKRHFYSHPACFFCNRPQVDRWTLCSRCSDIHPAHCNGLELFLELPQNKICYILITSNIYVFLLFPNNLHVCNLKVFYFNEIRFTYAIFDIFKEADWMVFEASANKFCYVPTILLYIWWKYKYWCIQKGLSDVI